MSNLNTIPGTANMDLARAESSGNRTRNKLEAAAQSGDTNAIRKAAEDFEAIFISQMMNHMFKNVAEGGGMFGGGQGESMWKGVYLDEISKSIAGRGGVGVADAIERQLLQLQEAN